jgi:hypothetical protein
MATISTPPVIVDPKTIIPTAADFEELLQAKLSYEAKQNTPERDAWNKANFTKTPWGISYTVSKAKHEKSVASYQSRGKAAPAPKNDKALRYFIAAVAIDWKELIDQLKRTLKNWGYTSKSLHDIATNFWLVQPYSDEIAKACDSVTVTKLIEQLNNTTASELTEAIEKHQTLNSKLFAKDEVLKDIVREKMLEIVDEFLADLKEQDVKIKVDDILFIGSNASYNYTKDSDIDLHIIANTKAVNYPEELGEAIYSAYRSLFNKQLSITIYDIPLELFVEIEDSPRVSNGVYSVKKNKWVKKPVAEDIPEYDKEALDELVDKWEAKCKTLIDDIKADKLNDETKVVKLLEDIYEKLRKNGIAKGEYSVENLTFKELRNKGYLDQLKDYRNELVSKRLSLEEQLSAKTRRNIEIQIAQAAGTQPIVQDNGMFFIYNLKASDIDRAVRALKALDFVEEVYKAESGKLDFSKMIMAPDQMPAKYYNIRGKVNWPN